MILTQPKPMVCSCGCGKEFLRTHPRKKYATPTCADKVMRQQLTDLATRRKAAKVKTKVKCTECETEFLPYSSRHLTCSAPCAERRLERAIERQRQRRTDAKVQQEQRNETSVVHTSQTG